MTKQSKTVQVGRHTFLVDIDEGAIYVAVPEKRKYVRVYLPDADRVKVVDAAIKHHVL
jgi:hypothetical protein